MAVINKIYLSQLEFAKRIDGELYNPKYKSSYNTLIASKYLLKKLKNQFFIRSGTTPNDRDNSLSSGPILFKTTDIRNEVLIPFGSFYHISNEIHSRMKNTQLKTEDVLLNIVGATLDVIGRSAYFSEYFDEANITQAMVLLRRKSNILPGYLFAYLNTKYAQDQIKRFARPTGQYNLNLIEVGAIEIPNIASKNQIAIDHIIRKSGEKKFESQYLYTQATQLLEKALGLDKIEFKREKSYTASFSEITSNNRADADFYQTQYRQLSNYLETLNTTILGKECIFTKGIEVGSAAYADEGPLFIRVSNISKNGIEIGNSDKYISQNLYNSIQIYQPQIGDILLTKDGTIGTCYVVDEFVQGIISGGILKLTLLNPDIPSEYLALVINSKIGSMQARRDCSGALILHWKPEQIRKLKIPILSNELMQKLADLVIKSKEARKESKQLLEQAKHEVEHLIEQAAQSA